MYLLVFVPYGNASVTVCTFFWECTVKKHIWWMFFFSMSSCCSIAPYKSHYKMFEKPGTWGCFKTYNRFHFSIKSVKGLQCCKTSKCSPQLTPSPFLSIQPWCRLITTIYNYFVVTNFFWMFVEGCYLHTAIVMTYSTDKLRKWVFLFIGWCELISLHKSDYFERPNHLQFALNKKAET